MTLTAYSALAASSLFVIIDPIATVPAFLAMTPHDTPPERRRMAALACGVAAGVLVFFAFTGQIIFHLLGITLPAFKMAGSIVLLLIALDMLRARRSAVQETAEETRAGADKADIAVAPLGVPMLAGPGAISTALLLRAKAEGVAQHVALLLAIVVVCLASYIVLRFASQASRWIGPIGLKITTRLMGLLLAAVAFQFMIDALRDLKLAPPPEKSAWASTAVLWRMACQTESRDAHPVQVQRPELKGAESELRARLRETAQTAGHPAAHRGDALL
jgi:multiple antibiotic resistance protein